MVQNDTQERPELVNFVELTGEVVRLEVSEYRVTLFVKNRLTNLTYPVVYQLNHRDVVEATAPKGSLVHVKGWLSKDSKYETSELLIKGWSPEQHLVKANAEDTLKSPVGRLIGVVVRVLRRNIIELLITNTYNNKDHEQTLSLGLSKRVRQHFRSRAHLGCKIEAKVVLEGEPRFPWDGTPRIVDFSILEDKR